MNKDFLFTLGIIHFFNISKYKITRILLIIPEITQNKKRFKKSSVKALYRDKQNWNIDEVFLADIASLCSEKVQQSILHSDLIQIIVIDNKIQQSQNFVEFIFGNKMALIENTFLYKKKKNLKIIQFHKLSNPDLIYYLKKREFKITHNNPSQLEDLITEFLTCKCDKEKSHSTRNLNYNRPRQQDFYHISNSEVDSHLIGRVIIKNNQIVINNIDFYEKNTLVFYINKEEMNDIQLQEFLNKFIILTLYIPICHNHNPEISKHNISGKIIGINNEISKHLQIIFKIE